MMFQLADGTTQRLKTPFYCYASRKIGPHIPPDQGQARRNDEPFFPLAALRLLGNRINFERFDKRRRGVRQTLRNEEILQRFSISEIEHGPGSP
jgi:hypothetical protein